MINNVSELLNTLLTNLCAVVYTERFSQVKFDVHRVDNMVIQSIALLDQLDKDINLFGMRIREWLVNVFNMPSEI